MKILTIILCIIVAAPVSALEYELPDDLWIHAKWFNIDPDVHSSDALTLKEDHTTVIIAPEWIRGSQSDGVAYVRNTQADFWATIRKYELCDIDSASVKPVTSIGTFDYQMATYPGTYEDCVVEFENSSGSIQNSVGVFILKIGWYCNEVNGQTVNPPAKIDSTQKTCYVVYDTPQAPMDSAWVDVLDYACDWAAGETTAVGCATDITEGIYWDLGDTDGDIDYGSGEDYWNDYTTPASFKLKTFFQDLITENQVEIKCGDTSALCVIFNNAVGLTTTRKDINCDDDQTYDFDPLGDAEGWQSKGPSDPWENHIVAFTDSVYDPCIRLDHGGGEFVPTNISLDDYKEYLFVYPEYVGHISYFTPGVCN